MPARAAILVAALLAVPATGYGAITAPWVGTGWTAFDDQGGVGLVGLGVDRTGAAAIFLSEQVSLDGGPIHGLVTVRRPAGRAWGERTRNSGDARLVRTDERGQRLVVGLTAIGSELLLEAALGDDPPVGLATLADRPLQLDAALSADGQAVVAVGDGSGLRAFVRSPAGRWSPARRLDARGPVADVRVAMNASGDIAIGWARQVRSPALWIARRGPARWDAPVAIGRIRRSWDLALDPLGVAHVIAEVQPGGILGAHNAAGRRAWIRQTVVDRGTGIGLRGLGVDDAGRALALFAAADGALLTAGRPAAGRWSAPRPVPQRAIRDNGFTGLAVGAFGHVLISTSALNRFVVQDRDPFGGWSRPRPVLVDPNAGAMTVPRVVTNAAGDAVAAWATGFSNTATDGFAVARAGATPPELRAARIAAAAGRSRPLRFALDRGGPVLLGVRAVGARRPAAAVIVRGRRGAQRLAWPRPLAAAIRRPGTYVVTFATAARAGGPAGRRMMTIRIR